MTKLVSDIEIILEERIATYPDFPKKGVSFKDIQSILADPELLRLVTEKLFSALPQKGAFDKILCFDARGFLFGTILALHAGVPMIMARKKGKLPGELITQGYEKEYGTDYIEVQKGLIQAGDRIIIHDDLLATGGTSEAAAKIIQSCGASVAGFNYVMEIEELGGRKIIEKYCAPEHINSVVTF